MTDHYFEEFRGLHYNVLPLLLPNAWDHASAAALAARGFTAIGTTSLGVAAAAGKPDGTGDARDETMALARGMVRLPAMISVDLEGGFSDSPQQVGVLAAELAQAGVVGINIEDGRPDGSLISVQHQCDVIAAVKQAAPRLFVNARTDAYWLGGDDSGGDDSGGEPGAVAVGRAQAYQQAGADGIFVPGLEDEQVISTLVKELSVPLNILLRPGGLTYVRLAELGVGRVSCGSVLFRLAVHSAVEFAWSVAHGNESRSDIPSYTQIQALALDFEGETARRKLGPILIVSRNVRESVRIARRPLPLPRRTTRRRPHSPDGGALAVVGAEGIRAGSPKGSLRRYSRISSAFAP